MAEPLKHDDLVSLFAEAERPSSRFLIGAESEKFGVHRVTGAPLMYDGEFSACRVLGSLCAEHGWTPIVESPDGPVLGAKRGGASVTLEPGAQLELSGDALMDLHQIQAEALMHLREIAPISNELDIAWLATGFHPTARLSELPWVPKQRYPIMRDYLPTKGKAGLDMMQRTATTQGNFDWKDEQDAMKKLVVALKLSPLMQAWFSNAPFLEGRIDGPLSHRGIVWQNMDPSRSGLIRALWSGDPVSYGTYIDWALDAGMFLFRRGTRLVKNTGQTFREFMRHGFDGHTASLDDFRLHLTTLFPEVRLKNTIEVRSVDALPPPMAMAALSVWTGILYDQVALDGAFELLSSWSYDEIEAVRPAMTERALHAELYGRVGFDWASDVVRLARDGLVRRGRRGGEGSNDESIYLGPAEEIVLTKRVPAEQALETYHRTKSFVSATAIEMPAFS